MDWLFGVYVAIGVCLFLLAIGQEVVDKTWSAKGTVFWVLVMSWWPAFLLFAIGVACGTEATKRQTERERLRKLLSDLQTGKE